MRLLVSTPSRPPPKRVANGRSVPPAPLSKPNPDAPVVLVVDDDASIRKMVARALGAAYTVYEAVDGLSALEILPQIAEPAVIVCDVMMPQIDGVTLVKELRKHPTMKGIPVIFLTAKSSPKDVVLGINAGARHYLTKPFSVKDLIDKVASIVKTRPAKSH